MNKIESLKGFVTTNCTIPQVKSVLMCILLNLGAYHFALPKNSTLGKVRFMNVIIP